MKFRSVMKEKTNCVLRKVTRLQLWGSKRKLLKSLLVMVTTMPKKRSVLAKLYFWFLIYCNCTILVLQFSIEWIVSLSFLNITIRYFRQYVVQFLISRAYVTLTRLIWHYLITSSWCWLSNKILKQVGNTRDAILLFKIFNVCESFCHAISPTHVCHVGVCHLT